jgi:hypothetical protein
MAQAIALRESGGMLFSEWQRCARTNKIGVTSGGSNAVFPSNGGAGGADGIGGADRADSRQVKSGAHSEGEGAVWRRATGDVGAAAGKERESN